MDSKGEVLLTIMASLAQQESQSLSQNVKLGPIPLPTRKVLVTIIVFGLWKDEEGGLIIIPEEAEIIRRIIGSIWKDSPQAIAKT